MQISNKSVRILASLLAFVMVVGVLATMPLTSLAYNTNDSAVKKGTVSGTPLPEGAAAWDGTPRETVLDGSGTAADPYLIADAADFMYFRDTMAATAVGAVEAAEGVEAVEGTHFKLTGDIYLNTADFGGALDAHNELSATLPNFAGILDGDGHVVYNLYRYYKINDGNRVAISLFNEMSGTVKNLTFEGTRFGGTTTATIAQTMLEGGRIENVHLNNTNIDSNGNAGGLVVYTRDDTIIKNCSISGEVYSTSNNVGGFVAAYDDGDEVAPAIIEKCVNNATVKGTHSHGRVGGLVGADNNGGNSYGLRVINCVNNGDVTANNLAGGMVGYLYRPNSAADYIGCVNNGKITGKYASGYIGSYTPGSNANATLKIENCVNYGDVEGSTYVGGFIAELMPTSGMTLTDCVNYGTIKATGAAGYAGGFAGKIAAYNPRYKAASITITNGANYGNVESAYAAGGIAGQFYHSTGGSKFTVNGFVADCDVIADVYASAVAGVYDFDQYSSNGNKGMVLTNTYLRGTVTSKGSAVAVFGAGSPNSYIATSFKVKENDKTITYYSYTPITTVTADAPFATATANNCGFDLTFYANGALVPASDVKSIRYSYISDRYDSSIVYANNSDTYTLEAFLALYDESTTVSYNSGSELITTAAYPAIDGNSFTNGTILSTMNIAVLTNNMTEGATQQTPWVQDKTAPTLVTTLGISGATMSLGSNMALNMKLYANALTGIQAMINASDAIVDKTISVAFVNGEDANATVTNDGTYFTASYAGIRAADMAEEMKLHLVITIAGTEYVSTNILTYSPLTYLTNLYADYTGEKQGEANATEVLDVVTAMLGYGAAAETKDSGATTIAAKMTELEITAPTFTEGYTDHISGVVTEDDKTAINNIAQVGATLTGGMELTFTMKNTAYTALSIADFGTFTADENGKITVTGINASMILDTLSLTFTGDGVDGISANFTVGDFLESRRDNADETALAEATILYMMAARAYVLN